MATVQLDHDASKTPPSTRYLLGALLLLFLVKTTYLAFWAIPLSDISDEPGHFSYILDMVEGKGIPVIGKTPFNQDVRKYWLTGKWKEDGWYGENYIAQHPPLYYAANALIVSVADNFVTGHNNRYRAARLLSVLSGTLALLVFYSFFQTVSNDRTFALFATAVISFIPIYGYQSSGVSHDAFLALLGGLSALYWAKFLNTGKIRFGLLMAGFLSLAAITKSTALLLLTPVVGITFLYIKEERFLKRCWIFVLIASVAILLPGLWMLRSYLNYGHFFSTWMSVMVDFNEADFLKIGIVQYLTDTQVVEDLYSTFFGEFGWAGTGDGVLVLYMKRSEYFMPLYYVLGAFFICASFAAHIKCEMSMFHTRFPLISTGVIVVLGYLLYLGVPVMRGAPGMSFVYATMIASFLFALLAGPVALTDSRRLLRHTPPLPLKVGAQSKARRFIYWSLLICAFYSSVFIWELKGLYEYKHGLMAIHGRYWFPVLPLLVCAFMLPAYRLVKIPQLVLGLIVLAMGINEFLAYRYYALPGLNS